MKGFGQRYVIDTNVLGQLRRHRRASAFFRENAVIPSEVLREAQGFPDIDALRKNRLPTTPKVLNWLVTVMATIPAADTNLVNLYANLGGADPFVVACALNGQDVDSVYLDAPEWIVVTGDAAVRDKAEEFGLKVFSSGEFAAIVDSAEGG
ncbi:hypothetical protein [Cryobacterium sp. Y11]|uniref:hypothetical protein n=1 Tax=Cryobacterium sp. Y11 TaxID=2045016 RepID=UPI000CE4C7D5|nr:hypothetical protein [Cryobacterium sp. Y11]